MIKLKYWVGWLVCLMAVLVPLTVGAQTSRTDRVLLVYDSQNRAENEQNKIAAVQRILISSQVPVTTMPVSDYRAGGLRHYRGVITMINWPETKLENSAFLHDRQYFKGIKLHIGQNLTAREAAGLGARRRELYHQQFQLQNQAKTVHQLLAFSETMMTLTNLPKRAVNYGELQAQGDHQRRYPYGTVVGQQGYLPFFSTSGYSFVLAAKTITALFSHAGHYQPLLTITKVTPYSNLTLLNQLSRYLYAEGIPFAISTTTVGENGDFKAYKRFAKVLRLVENRGGVIFLKMPVVGGVTAHSGPTLSTMLDNNIIQFAQNQVFPVGMSASAYWNQDKVYRRSGLRKANTILWLPDPQTPVYAHQDNQAQTFKRGIYGLPAASLETVAHGSALGRQALDFPLPTAVTFTMPNTTKTLRDLKRRIQRLNYQWYNPATQGQSTAIKSGTATIGYHRGTYFLNGAVTTIDTSATVMPKLRPVKPAEIWVNRFFKTQGKFLLIFFLGAMVVFVAFIWLGWRVYRNMFKRK